MPAGMMAGSASISIHSLRVEGDGGHLWREPQKDISIHSLRVEGDQEPRRCDTGGALISIHSLRVEGDFYGLQHSLTPLHFNPLPPCGGRHLHPGLPRSQPNFNPLPPCGGRRFAQINAIIIVISIHSLRVEGDLYLLSDARARAFQSTPSVWRETAPAITTSWQPRNFNPLPPCGGRRQTIQFGS